MTRVERSRNAGPVYLIDASIYIFRYYFSEQPSRLSPEGREVSTVLAYTRWLRSFLGRENPQALAVCFDESLESGFRHSLDAAYKSQRSLPDAALAYELATCKSITRLMGLPCYASRRFEADDLLAALARHAMAKKREVFILSRDKDLAQVLMPDCGILWDYPTGEKIDWRRFIQLKGLRPDQVPDYLALVGDSVDGIVGVPGLGDISARKILARYQNWKVLQAHLNVPFNIEGLRSAEVLRQRIIAARERIALNLKLTRLHFSAVSKTKAKLQREAGKALALKKLFLDLGFPKSMIENPLV